MLILFVSSIIIFVVSHRSILLYLINILLTKVIKLVDRTKVYNFIHSTLILIVIYVIAFELVHKIILPFDISYLNFRILLGGHYRDSDILLSKYLEMNYLPFNSFSSNLQ